MLEWHFFDKVYRVWAVLLVGEPEEFYAFMDKAGYSDIEGLKQGSTAAMCIKMCSDNNDIGNDCIILWMRKWELACLVHELSHLVMFALDDKGVPIRQENTEAFAYYQEFWFNEMTRVRRRFPNGRSSAQTKKDKYGQKENGGSVSTKGQG